MGQNKKGSRSLQAAQYPPGLCAAICSGIKHQMELDYGVSMACREGRHAYAIHEQQDEAVDSEDGPLRSNAHVDFWQVEGDRLIRHHKVPRQKFFTPTPAMKFPEGVAYESILEGRQTEINFVDNAQSTVDRDDWFNQPAREMDEFWIGKTLFKIQRPHVEVQDVAAPAAAPRDDELMEVPMEVERTVPAVSSTPGGRPAPKTPGGSSALKRRKPTRQLQRGFWQEVEEPKAIGLLNETMEYAEEIALEGWGRLDLSPDLGERWKSHESAQSEVQLILISSKAVRMRKPQPFAGPAEVSMRRSYLLLQSGKVLATSWEDWCKMAPSSQVRPLVAKSRKLYVVAFGCPLSEGLLEKKNDRFVAKEEERQRKWQVLPRELKLAIKRIHCNLGHASVPTMLRALRMSKA